MKELLESFQQYFHIMLADTPALMEQVHRIRYEVFCQEFHFEREEDCPGGLEKDEYDAQSVHCLVIHKASTWPAGCVRLVNTLKDDPSVPLPIEKYCGASLYQGPQHPSRLPRESMCEISRLAVSPNFRRRKGESKSPLGNVEELRFDTEEARLFPLISFAVFIAILSLAVITRRQNGYAVMEPWLAQHLKPIGFSFEQIGEPTEYHGTRVAFHYTLERALRDRDREPMLKDIFDVTNPVMEAEAARVNLNLTT